MTDDFFAALKRQIAEQGLTERARQDKIEALNHANLGFVGEVLPQLHDLIGRYDGKLQELGYHSYMNSGSDHVQISLDWPDGGRIILEYRRETATNGIIRSHSRTHPHAVLSKPETRSLNRSTWDPIAEELFIQKVIQDFTDEAVERGGL